MGQGGEREQLQSELVSEREALLAVVSGVDEPALTWRTRNAGWAVRDVLAHVLASDADLIRLFEEAGRPGIGALRMPGLKGHQREMVRWRTATPRSFAQELRERGDRWRRLLAALPGTAFSIQVSGDWWPQDAMAGSGAANPETAGGVRPLSDVVADWRGHDTQHGEDVRLALAEGEPGGNR